MRTATLLSLLLYSLGYSCASRLRGLSTPWQGEDMSEKRDTFADGLGRNSLTSIFASDYTFSTLNPIVIGAPATPNPIDGSSSPQPSQILSAFPTGSSFPSSSPSNWPSSEALPQSGVPSTASSGIPSWLPSDVPSSIPSWLPSNLPSSLPSWLPSGVPTYSSSMSEASFGARKGNTADSDVFGATQYQTDDSATDTQAFKLNVFSRKNDKPFL